MLLDYFSNTINGYLPKPQASLLNGITFGIPLHTSKEFYNNLKIVGILHVVVLSGSNVAFMTTIFIQMTSFFSKRISLVITMLGLILFLYLVSFQAPIMRATFMGVLTIVAELYGRKVLTLYALLISAIVLVLFDANLLSSVSFQLSYGATLGIILFSKGRIESNSIRQYITTTMKTTLAAQIFVMPIITYYFHQISIISPLTNLLILWTIEPLLLLGLITGMLGTLFTPIAHIASFASYGLLTYITTIVNILAQVPFASINF